jgi:hypothetical protein
LDCGALAPLSFFFFEEKQPKENGVKAPQSKKGTPTGAIAPPSCKSISSRRRVFSEAACTAVRRRRRLASGDGDRFNQKRAFCAAWRVCL